MQIFCFMWRRTGSRSVSALNSASSSPGATAEYTSFVWQESISFWGHLWRFLSRRTVEKISTLYKCNWLFLFFFFFFVICQEIMVCIWLCLSEWLVQALPLQFSNIFFSVNTVKATKWEESIFEFTGMNRKEGLSAGKKKKQKNVCQYFLISRKGADASLTEFRI